MSLVDLKLYSMMIEPFTFRSLETLAIYRFFMHIRIRVFRFVMRILGQDTSEIDELLAENRMLRRAIKEQEAEHRRTDE
jgi:hypothetical protein